jgi:hypothetical protein
LYSIIDISLKYVHCSVILDMGLFESRVIRQQLMVDYHVLTKIAIPIALFQTTHIVTTWGPASDVCWLVTPLSIVISIVNHGRYWSDVHQLTVAIVNSGPTL